MTVVTTTLDARRAARRAAIIAATRREVARAQRERLERLPFRRVP